MSVETVITKHTAATTRIVLHCSITPFPTPQGSSSVTDAPKDDVILNAKKRKLLDGEDDDDKVDDDTDKDEDDNHKDMDEDDKDENDKDKDEDDTDTAAKEATKITTPSKSETVAARTSSRGRPIGSGKKGFCSPPLIFSCP